MKSPLLVAVNQTFRQGTYRRALTKKEVLKDGAVHKLTLYGLTKEASDFLATSASQKAVCRFINLSGFKQAHLSVKRTEDSTTAVFTAKEDK